MDNESNKRVIAAEKPKKKSKKTVRNIVYGCIFIAVTVLTFYYLFKDDPVETLSIVSKIQFFPLLIAVALVALTVFMDAISLMYFTRLYNPKYTYRQSVMNVIIGNFVGVLNKTSSTFIQAYTFTKQGVKGANGASIVTMNFLMYQITFTFYSLFVVFIGYQYVSDITIDLLGGIHIFPLSLIGFGMAAFFLVGMIALAFCRPLHNFVLNGLVNLLAKMRIVKNPHEKRKSWAVQFATYRVELKRLSRHWGLSLLAIVTNVIKQMCYCTLPYLVFMSLGDEILNLGFGSSFCAVGYLNLISSVITIGAPEVGFQSVFNTLFVQVGVNGYSSYISAANFIWRILNFYAPLIVGALCFFFYKGSDRKLSRVLESSPTTIYDLQAMHLYDLYDTSEYQHYEIKKRNSFVDERTNEEVMSDFTEIQVNEDVDYDEHDLDNEQLALGKASLARVVAEADDLANEFTPDDEIEIEVKRSLAYCKEKANASLEKKKQKVEEKVEKANLKRKKELLKRQMDGDNAEATDPLEEIEEEKYLPYSEEDTEEAGGEEE